MPEVDTSRLAIAPPADGRKIAAHVPHPKAGKANRPTCRDGKTIGGRCDKCGAGVVAIVIRPEGE